MWIDENKRVTETLVEQGPTRLKTLNHKFYRFTFSDLTQTDISSIAFRIDHYVKIDTFVPYDFVKFLLNRNIKFDVEFVYQDNASKEDNRVNEAVVKDIKNIIKNER